MEKRRSSTRPGDNEKSEKKKAVEGTSKDKTLDDRKKEIALKRSNVDDKEKERNTGKEKTNEAGDKDKSRSKRSSFSSSLTTGSSKATSSKAKEMEPGQRDRIPSGSQTSVACGIKNDKPKPDSKHTQAASLKCEESIAARSKAKEIEPGQRDRIPSGSQASVACGIKNGKTKPDSKHTQAVPVKCEESITARSKNKIATGHGKETSAHRKSQGYTSVHAKEERAVGIKTENATLPKNSKKVLPAKVDNKRLSTGKGTAASDTKPNTFSLTGKVGNGFDGIQTQMMEEEQLLDDIVLKFSCPGEEPRFLIWIPSSQHSLAPSDKHYAEFQTISRTVHFGDYEESSRIKTMVEYPVRAEHYTRLESDILGLWFGLPIQGHNWYGNITFSVNLKKLEWFILSKKYNVYLLEIVQFDHYCITRYLVASPDDPMLPKDLILIDNKTYGGPWYQDEHEVDHFLTSIRTFQGKDMTSPNLPNETAWFFRISEDDRAKLFKVADISSAEHGKVNSIHSFRCYKYRSAQKCQWVMCPYELSQSQMQEHLKAEWMLETIRLLHSNHFGNRLASEMGYVVKQFKLESEEMKRLFLDSMEDCAMKCLDEEKKAAFEEKRTEMVRRELKDLEIKDGEKSVVTQNAKKLVTEVDDKSAESDVSKCELEEVEREVKKGVNKTLQEVNEIIQHEIHQNLRGEVRQRLEMQTPEVINALERRMTEILEHVVHKVVNKVEDDLVAYAERRQKKIINNNAWE